MQHLPNIPFLVKHPLIDMQQTHIAMYVYFEDIEKKKTENGEMFLVQLCKSNYGISKIRW